MLSSLPDVVGVVDQGGDGYGAAEAFKASGRKEPVIIMGNRQVELAWWQQQHAANGYTTMSASSAPGLATFAFWIAQQVLDGKKIPHDIWSCPITPFPRISSTQRSRLRRSGALRTSFTRSRTL